MNPKASWLAVLLVGVLPGQHGHGPKTTAAPVPAAAPVPIQPVTLEGKPFPPVAPYRVTLPRPRRTLFAATGKEPGDGTEAHPWNDLQAALGELGPGDRLLVRAGDYRVSLRIGESCRNGTTKEPIQVVFDAKARLAPEGELPGVAIDRTDWTLVGGALEMKESAAPGINVGRDARGVAIDGVRVLVGAGPGVRIEPGVANVTVSNSRFLRAPGARGGATAPGIEIAGGTDRVGLVNDLFAGQAGGSIRIGSVFPGTPPARHVIVRGNTMRFDDTAAIDVASALDVQIVENVLVQPAGAEARAIEVGRARGVVVRRNEISGFPVAIRVGFERSEGAGPAEEVTIERNLLESGPDGGTALDVESAHGIRFSNNVVAGYGPAVAVFGKPRRTKSVTVANNLFLKVSDTAFVVADPLALALFDYNIYSPEGAMPAVEVEGTRSGLDAFLKGGKMPHSSVAPGVVLLQRDLARVSGAQVVDRGKLLPGLEAKGSAPDVGVAEK